MIAIFAAGMLGGLTQLASRLSRSMKRGTTIAALVTAAVLAGHAVSAQVAPLPPLSNVPVPKPNNLGDFVKNEGAAIALGKALFWDMELGSDGIQSCASCHFHAGADNRSKNQINPGQKGGDNTFNIGGHPNYQLTGGDYPFQSNDVAGSQGVFKSEFVDVAPPGSDKDIVTPRKDDVFNVQDINVRQVTDRNTPTVINAVFNFRNFWDGRAQNIFNGVNPFGLRDPNAFVLKATNPRLLEDVPVKIENSSLASQAVGPPLSAFETSAENTTIITPFRAEVTNNTISVTDARNDSVVSRESADLAVSTDGASVTDARIGSVVSSESADLATPTDGAFDANNQNASNSADLSRRQPPTPIKRFGRKLGKKLLSRKPLAKQNVHPEDSVLGSYRAPDKGLNTTYEAMVQAAFKPEWWNSDLLIRVDPKTGDRRFFRKPRNIPLRRLGTNVFTLAEYNFSLFFGLAVQAYESTLISAQTPFDQFLANNPNALTQEQRKGWEIFKTPLQVQNGVAQKGAGGCIGCHGGTEELVAELTSASVRSVASQKRIRRLPPAGNRVQDTGFFNIGVRPQAEDLGVGGNDEVDIKDPSKNNPLSEARLALQGKFKQLLGEEPPLVPNSEQDLIANGAFKTPGLRNVELTAPYFHNGGQLTLEQVVDFYARGGDFGLLAKLDLTAEDKQALVAFMKSLTDERVRYQQAPFDHPQLFVPNGHPGDQNAVANDPNVQTQDGTKQAVDALLEIPAVGRNGGNLLPNFLGTYSTTVTTTTP